MQPAELFREFSAKLPEIQIIRQAVENKIADDRDENDDSDEIHLIKKGSMMVKCDQTSQWISQEATMPGALCIWGT